MALEHIAVRPDGYPAYACWLGFSGVVLMWRWCKPQRQKPDGWRLAL